MYPIIRRQFPPQKKSIREKDEEWMKMCINAGITLALYNSDTRLRESKYNMRANYRLYDGILDQKDVERTMNPWGLDSSTFPAKMMCYPIASNKVSVLLGEETKRRFDWRIRVTNDDAVSEKEKMIKRQITTQLTQLAIEGETDEKVIAAKVKELDKWRKYEAQDMRERVSSHILKHLYQEQKLKLKFNQGFKDALIAGEEIYCADIIGGKPILRKVNPLTIYTVGMTMSPYIEDADIIVEDTYHSVGWVIDTFYDSLSADDIDAIERGTGLKSSGKPLIDYPAANNPFSRYSNMPDGSIEIYDNNFGNAAYDEEGNVRVSRVVWKSRRKVGKLKFYKDGEQLEDLVDELYKADKSAGEEIEWLWINEWWEGWKIGNSIYTKMGPRPVQFRRMDNLSICGSGYVGTIYNTNSSRSNSLMNKMKPYLYMYNVLMYRLEKGIAKYKGPTKNIDLAKIPDEWTLDQYLYYLEEMGYDITDSFKEGDKGQATGKLAGNFNTTGQLSNPDMGNYINHTMQLLSFIEGALGRSVGISPQREGSVDNRETVGGVERSVTQSSHATEEYFLVHDFTKLRALEVLLETAKYAYRNDSKVAQYILDGDMAQQMFKIDGGEFCDADYGLVMSDSSLHTEFRNTMVQLAQAGIQNDKLNFSSFMDVFTSESISDTRRKIEQYEEESIQRQQDSATAQQDHEKQVQQMQIENREDIQAAAMEIETLKANTQIELKLMELEAKGAEVSPTISEENPLDREKFEAERLLKERQLQEAVRSSLVAEQQKDKEIGIKQQIANKPTPKASK
jgi:hypothetical protein